MTPKIQPHNNDWNRKYNFMEESATGFLIEIKNGMAYFAWKFADGRLRHYKCEESVFEKNFDTGTDLVSFKMEEGVKINYKRYPIEMH